ncbi:MAG: c-type cytochrome [Candidatus Rokubacteria bacterium]|nr:c-type cytochrome [Candidatus Rokubacteria bacterium]
MTMLTLVFLLLLLAAPDAAAGPLDHPGYAKAFSCSACHGFAGNSRSATMPILAGMNTAYLKKALQDYASGMRPSPEMEPYSKMAIHLGVDDVAGYFAAQTKQPTPIAADAAAVARGRTASQVCVACHGPAGKGDPAKNVPDLTGQPAAYLAHQIQLFKADRRSPGDPALKQLKEVMKAVPDNQIADLAAYYSSLR